MLHPFDLANLIAGDHRLAETLFRRLEQGQGDRQVLVDQMSVNVALHAGGEELVFYPAERDAGDDTTVEENLGEHRIVKDALIVLDRHDAGTPEAEEAIASIIEVVRRHARSEEHDQLPRLRAEVGDAGMVELGISFRDHQAKAPTHSHPHAPTNPVTAAGAALVDKLRDKASGRLKEIATDASGLLDPQAQALVDAFANLGPKPPHVLEPPVARTQPTATDAVKAMMAAAGKEGPEPVGLITESTIPGAAADILLRTYQPAAPADTGALPVIAYIHGGGWVIADLDVYDASARALSNRTGTIVVSIEYRKAPEFPFPAAHDDVLTAVRWIMANAASLGGDPTRVAIAGESAGGNMAAATCLSLQAAGEALPVFQVLIYPVTSTAMDTDSYSDAADAKPLYSGLMNWFFGSTITDVADLADPRLDLLSVPTEQLAGLPPALIITAERDPLRDEGEAFAERLREAGVDVEATRYDGMMHEFFGAAAVLDKADAAQAQAANALRHAFGLQITSAAASPRA